MEQPKNYVSVGSTWKHKSGESYTVLEFLHIELRDPINWPVIVVLQNLKNGNILRVMLGEWHQSMTKAEGGE